MKMPKLKMPKHIQDSVDADSAEMNKELSKMRVEFLGNVDKFSMSELEVFRKLFGMPLYEFSEATGLFKSIDKVDFLNKDFINVYVITRKRALGYAALEYYFNRLHRAFPHLNITIDDFLLLTVATEEMKFMAEVVFAPLRKMIIEIVKEAKEEAEKKE